MVAVYLPGLAMVTSLLRLSQTVPRPQAFWMALVENLAPVNLHLHICLCAVFSLARYSGPAPLSLIRISPTQNFMLPTAMWSAGCRRCASPFLAVNIILFCVPFFLWLFGFSVHSWHTYGPVRRRYALHT